MRTVKYRYMIIIMLVIVLVLSFFKCCEVKLVGYQSVIASNGEKIELEDYRCVQEEKFASSFFVMATIVEVFLVVAASKKRYIFLALLVDCAKMFVPYFRKVVENLFTSIGCMYSRYTLEIDFNLVFYLIIAIECSLAIIYICELSSMWWHNRKLKTTGLYS